MVQKAGNISEYINCLSIDAMKFSRDTASTNIIVSYAAGNIRIRPAEGDILTLIRSLILTPQELILDWEPQLLADLQAGHLSRVVAAAPEVVLLGTGSRLRFPPASVLAPCYQAGVGVEVMDTGAACRTFNILAGEGRQVVAALLMIETTG